MANEEQLAILKQDYKVWNEWREKNPEIQIDLSGAELRSSIFSGADLSGADLFRAGLDGGFLVEANFVEANLNEADLRWATLIRADFSRANLSGANLSGANLRGANLNEANLSKANLSKANLNETDLSWADLSWAKISGADLGAANLSFANFGEAFLSLANLSGAKVGGTYFVDVDLSEAKGLEEVKHGGPSSIGIDTIYKSKGKIPEVFLRGCGVPQETIDFYRGMLGKAKEFYSCFISHSAKDQRFCERLYADLQSRGVRVWYFPEDAKWGESVWGEIDRSIRVYDKLIVVCSENSLQSGPVNREIERSIVREDKESKGVLFPIRLDDYIFNSWEHERKADVVKKVVGDFSGWDTDAAKYEKAFDRLLKGLQAGSGESG